MHAHPPYGSLLREWRQRRRLSQLALALEAGISTRHLSCVETGRARPSRGLILHLGELLEVPLRERNRWLLSAGYAPHFAEQALDALALEPAMAAIERVLEAHEPLPALLLDRHWNVLRANRAAWAMMSWVAPELRVPPINVLRLSFHPQGLAPRILNEAEFRRHVEARLQRLIRLAEDPVLRDLQRELCSYPRTGTQVAASSEPLDDACAEALLPMRLATPLGEISLFSTVTVFGTPGDISLAEVALECLYPADGASRERLLALTAGEGSSMPGSGPG
jgi:transcriptional regulator with XRE-family HTH domain